MARMHSTSVRLENGSVPFPQPLHFLASYDIDVEKGEGPTPLTLIVAVDEPEQRWFAPPSGGELDLGELLFRTDAFLPAGSLNYFQRSGGLMRLTYGVGAASRALVADLKAGVYQLPAVESARLEVMLWNPLDAGLGDEYRVAAAFSPGSHRTAPARLTYTSVFPQLIPGEYFSIAAPNGARWLQFSREYANVPHTTLASGPWGSLTLDDTFTYHDPIEIAPNTSVSLINNAIEIDTRTLYVRWFLEL